MRNRDTRRNPRITITSALGCTAVVLGLIPAVAVATAGSATTAAAPTSAAASVVDVRSRVAALELQADDAGRAAQIADEAVLQDRSPVTEAAADRAHAALVALAERQTPELTRLAARLDDLGAELEPVDAVDATTVALSGRTKALRAVSYARKQIGDAYGFAKAGPNAFDCSGLTMKAYQSVKVGIGGHGATAQYRKAKAQHRLVSYGKRQRGDLIFYGSPGSVYHVAIYTGNGKMIEAPYPGKRVREVPVRSGGRLGQVARPAR